MSTQAGSNYKVKTYNTYLRFQNIENYLKPEHWASCCGWVVSGIAYTWVQVNIKFSLIFFSSWSHCQCSIGGGWEFLSKQYYVPSLNLLK